MNELDELLAKSEIKFPKPINKPLFENLLDRISVNLDSDIDYTAESSQRVTHRDAKPSFPVHEYNGIKYSGRITLRKTFASSSFYTENPFDNPEKISSIRFQTIPGYSLQEHRPEEVAVWDKTRKVVEKYFAAL